MIFMILGWLACSVLSAGMVIGHARGEWPSIAEEDYRKNLGFGFLFGILGGPITVVMLFFFTGFCEHGWSLSRPHD